MGLGDHKATTRSGQLENRTENEVRLIMQFYFQPSVPHCSSSMLSLCHLVNNSNIHQLSNCSPFFCEVISHRCSRRFASLAGTEVTSPGAKASFAQLNGPMASRCNCRSGSPKAWNIRRTTRFRPSASCTWTWQSVKVLKARLVSVWILVRFSLTEYKVIILIIDLSTYKSYAKAHGFAVSASLRSSRRRTIAPPHAQVLLLRWHVPVCRYHQWKHHEVDPAAAQKMPWLCSPENV